MPVYPGAIDGLCSDGNIPQWIKTSSRLSWCAALRSETKGKWFVVGKAEDIRGAERRTDPKLWAVQHTQDRYIKRSCLRPYLLV